ncbi:unnamed protein product [Sphagnum balticum]
MATTNNPNEPIAVTRNEGIEAQSQTYLDTQELPAPGPHADQHQVRLTGAFQSIHIDIPLTATERPPHHDLLSPADIPNISRTFENSHEDLSLDLKYQQIWEESMEDMVLTGTPHKKAAVLMISWAEGLDELDTGPEVKELADTFRNLFHYDVVEVELTASKLPQSQLNTHLAKFIEDFDTESTLLIIYYAGIFFEPVFIKHPLIFRYVGHGVAPQPGELFFASAARGYWATRCFELLAACKHDQTTHPPGRKSFTRALIWALNSLLKNSEKFSTRELQTKISLAKDFPKHQVVRIIDRGGPCNYQLILAAAPVRYDLANPEAMSPRPHVTRPKKFIDLRFWYTKFPEEDEVKELSDRLKQLMHSEHIKAVRVGWLRLGDFDQDQVKNIVEKWRGLRRRRSTTTLTQLSIPHSPHQVHLQPSFTSTPSQSGNSSVSDAYIQSSNVFPISINVTEPFADQEVFETNDPDGDDPGRHGKRPSGISNDLDPRLKSSAGVISFNIDTSNTATLMSLAFFSFSLSFVICNRIFSKR